MISSGIGAILSAEGERDRPTAAIVTQFLGVQLRSGQIGILLRYANVNGRWRRVCIWIQKVKVTQFENI